MKKLLAVVAAVACATAFATDYMWTGAAGDNLWANKDNWGGSGYPSTATDIAQFTTSATVTFDAGEKTPIKQITATTANTEIIINADADGSTILAATAGLVSIGNGAKVTVNVPVVASVKNTSYVSGGDGDVTFTKEITYWDAAFNSNNRYGSLGRIHFAGDFFEDSYWSIDFGWNGGTPAGQFLSVDFADSATLIATNKVSGSNRNIVTLIGDGSTGNSSVEMTQDGDDTEITCFRFNVGGVSGSASVLKEHTYAKYVLKRGKLTVLESLNLAAKAEGSYIQEGGTAKIDTFSFGAGLAPTDRFAILGGSFTCRDLKNTSVIPLELSNCTFSVTATTACSTHVDILGDVTFDIPANVILNLKDVTIHNGSKIRTTGEGQVYFYCSGDSVLGDLDGAANLFRVGTGGKKGTFLLAGGTLVDKGNLLIGGVNHPGEMTIAGGTYETGTFAADSRGRLLLDGDGTLVTRNVTTVNNASGFLIEFRNGTYRPVGSITIDVGTMISGDMTFDVQDGVTLKFSRAPTFAAGAKITKTGAGTLEFAAPMMEWIGDLDIRAGMVTMSGEVTNPVGDDSVHTVTIADGAVLAAGRIKTSSTSATRSAIDSPIDLKVSGEGYVRSDSGAGWFAVRHLWVDGEPVARGTVFNTCANLTTAGAIYRGNGATSGRNQLVVTYTWTGLGADDLWTNADNWEDGAVPVNATKCWADLSKATTITLAADVDIGGILYAGNLGERKVVIAADNPVNTRTFYNFASTYQCAGYIAKGRELVFRDVRFMRSATTGSGIGYLYGLGTIVLEGLRQSTYATYGYPECTYLFRNATNANASSSITLGGFAVNQGVIYQIGEGTDVKFNKLIAGVSGHSGTYGVQFLEGCKAAFATGLYVSRHHSSWPTFLVDMFGGDISVAGDAGLSIGTSDYPKGGNEGRLVGKERFTMTGGTLTVKRVGCECNTNYAYLNGGEIYLGAGGFCRTDSVAEGAVAYMYAANVDAPIKWGGTVVHATESCDFGLEAELTGIGGEPTLDVAEGKTVTVTSNFCGAATLVKAGPGTLNVNWAVGAVSARIEEGVLAFGDAADFTTSMGTLALASEESLALASGQSLRVKTLIVDGAARAAGTYPWGEGEVVVGDGADDWLAAAAYTKNCTVSCNEAKTVSGIHYAYCGETGASLTIPGSGSLTFAADATISVRKGDTLTIAVPVTFNGKVDVVGGGTVVFATTAPITTPTDPTKLYIHGGTKLVLQSVVNDRAAGLSMYAVTARGIGDFSTLRIENGGYLRQALSVPTNDATDDSVGGIVEIAAGGTLALNSADNNAGFAGSSARDERLVLCGGTLRVPTCLKYLGGKGSFVFENGVYEIFDAAGLTLEERLPVTLGGEAVFSSTLAEDASSVIDAPLAGAGTFVKDGTGRIVLNGDQSGVTGYRVEAGTLSLSAKAASSVDPGTAVELTDGALELDFNGTLTVRTLAFGGKGRKAGVYSGENCPFITGGGTLTVTESSAPGVLILVR